MHTYLASLSILMIKKKRFSFHYTSQALPHLAPFMSHTVFILPTACVIYDPMKTIYIPPLGGKLCQEGCWICNHSASSVPGLVGQLGVSQPITTLIHKSPNYINLWRQNKHRTGRLFGLARYQRSLKDGPRSRARPRCCPLWTRTYNG